MIVRITSNPNTGKRALADIIAELNRAAEANKAGAEKSAIEALSILQERYGELSMENDRLVEINDKLRHEKATLVAKINELNCKNVNLDKENNYLQTQNDKLKNFAEQFREDYILIQRDNEKLKEAIKSMEHEINGGSEIDFRRGYQKGVADTSKDIRELHHDILNKKYQEGLNDAWDCIRKIYADESDGGFSPEVFATLFGDGNVVTNFTAAEAIAKIKEYEEQKRSEEINVGDEIINPKVNLTGVVTRIEKRVFDYSLTILDMSTGGSYLLFVEDLKNLRKTGKTHPEIKGLFVKK